MTQHDECLILRHFLHSRAENISNFGINSEGQDYTTNNTPGESKFPKLEMDNNVFL